MAELKIDNLLGFYPDACSNGLGVTFVVYENATGDEDKWGIFFSHKGTGPKAHWSVPLRISKETYAEVPTIECTKLDDGHERLLVSYQFGNPDKTIRVKESLDGGKTWTNV